MEIYFDYRKIPPYEGTVITMGNFDGFHLGHQKIVSHTVKMAKKLGLPALVITFQPHPRQLFSGDIAVLTPLDKKIDLLWEAGADMILVQPFTKAFAATAPSQFLEQVLYKALHCRHIVVGYDYSFGRAGSGDTKLLGMVTGRLGIGCDIIEPVTWGKEIISSTAVRAYLAQGNVEIASSYTGRMFSIRGRVEAGAGRGKKLGFPTANLYPPRSAALPAFGVYMVKVRIESTEYWGLANVGFHPTFPGNSVSMEVFIFAYQGNLYGQMIEVEFFTRLRPEIKFPDADSLKRQIEEDVAAVKALLTADNMLKLQRI